MRNITTTAIILSGLLLVLSPQAFSWQEGGPVTPYGDFCPRCTRYGTCKSPLSYDDAKKAMIEYYHKKGLNIEIEKISGRFIKAKVKDKNRVVDVIILDRHTGRIRSIY